MEKWTRRNFFLSTLAGSIAVSTRRLFGAAPSLEPASENVARESLPVPRTAQGTRPLIISAHNGVKHLDAGMAVLRSGGDTLDATLAVVTKVEDDPNDTSVGYGGLPNEDGVVELDASCMHGPSRRGGSVGAIRGIKTPSNVANLVLSETDHMMLVGDGALRFAKDYGFKEEDLLTERSRMAWLA